MNWAGQRPVKGGAVEQYIDLGGTSAELGCSYLRLAVLCRLAWARDLALGSPLQVCRVALPLSGGDMCHARR